MVRSVIGAPSMAARNGRTSPSSWHVSTAVADEPRSRRPRRRRVLAPCAVEAHLDVAAAAAEQLGHVGQSHDLAGAHDGHPVAQPLHLGQDVGREEDGSPGLAPLVEQVVEGALHQRVQALGRLVEDGQLWVVLERLDDADLLAHAAGVVAHRPLERPAGQLQPVDQLRAQRRRPPVQPGQVVEHLLAGQRVVQRDAAGQVASRRANGDAVADDVVAEHAPLAGGRMQEAEQQPDGRRLARAVGPQEAEDLAFANVDREVVQGAHDLVPAARGKASLAVVLGQTLRSR